MSKKKYRKEAGKIEPNKAKMQLIVYCNNGDYSKVNETVVGIAGVPIGYRMEIKNLSDRIANNKAKLAANMIDKKTALERHNQYKADIIKALVESGLITKEDAESLTKKQR